MATGNVVSRRESYSGTYSHTNVMELFEQVLVGILAAGVLFFFWPGAKAAMRKSREAENPDWSSALIPIGIVVLFIVFLIILARN